MSPRRILDYFRPSGTRLIDDVPAILFLAVVGSMAFGLSALVIPCVLRLVWRLVRAHG